MFKLLKRFGRTAAHEAELQAQALRLDVRLEFLSFRCGDLSASLLSERRDSS